MRIMAENSEFVDEMRDVLKVDESERATKENIVKFAIWITSGINYWINSSKKHTLNITPINLF